MSAEQRKEARGGRGKGLPVLRAVQRVGSAGRLAGLSVMLAGIAFQARAADLSSHAQSPVPHARAAASASVIQRHGRSLRGAIDTLPFVLLRGSGAERGEAYGVLCGRDVIELLDHVLIPAVTPEGWSGLVKEVESKFVFPEELVTQMDGFIRGFRQSANKGDRHVPSLDRELRLEDLKVLQAFSDLASSGRIKFGGCSSFSAWGALTDGGQVIMGRNLDYTTFGAIQVMILAQEPDEAARLKTLEVSIAGMFGASTALNEEGVLLMLHDETGLKSARQTGWVPRVVPLRAAIEKARAASAIDDIAQVLRHTPLAMGGNVHVSFPLDPRAPERLPVVIEWDGHSLGDGVTIRKPHAPEMLPAIFCTNHYLERRAGEPGGSSGDRYGVLVNAARQQVERDKTIQVSTAAEMMGKAAVRGGVSTYFSVIALPAERRLFVAVAPHPGAAATDGKWIEIKWSEVFGL